MDAAMPALEAAAEPAWLTGPVPAELAPTPQVAFTPAAALSERTRTAWDRLAEDAGEPNSFAERWFLEAGLRHLAEQGEVSLAEVWSGPTLIGLMPLVVGRAYGRMHVRHVRNWKHHHAFLGTPLIRRDREQAFWTALLAALDKADWAPNFLHIDGLVEHGAAHRAIAAAAGELRRPCATVHRTIRAELASTLSPHAYYERNVRKKKRKELKRLRNRLGETGTLATRTFTAQDSLSEWCGLFLALERSGWKGRAGSALAGSVETEAFFRQAVEGAHAAGRLQLLRLDVGDRPIAMLVNFLAPPGSFSFKIAYDEEFARFSPGVLIQIDNLAILSNPAIKWMDSCAAENHPMIDSLWAERRSIVRVTVPLSGLRRRAVYASCRLLENGSALLRGLKRKRPLVSEDNDD